MNVWELIETAKRRFLSQPDSAAIVAARHKAHDRLQTLKVRHWRIQETAHAAACAYRGLPEAKVGWFLSVVVVIFVVAVVLELYPAYMAALTFQGTSWLEITALTAGLAVLGALCGDFAGELLKSHRDPGAHRSWVHALFLFLVGGFAAAYLWTGYEMRLAYALDVGVDYGVSRESMALGLVVLSALGMVFAAIAAYHSESLEAFRLRRKVRQLERALHRLEAEAEHAAHLFKQQDQECRVAALPYVVTVLQQARKANGHTSVTADQVTRYFLGDVLSGESEPAGPALGTVSAHGEPVEPRVDTPAAAPSAGAAPNDILEPSLVPHSPSGAAPNGEQPSW